MRLMRRLLPLLTALVLALQPAADTAARFDLDGLADRADWVVDADVLAVTALEDAKGRIFTEYRLRVGRAYHGEVEGEVVVKVPGGVLPSGRGTILPGLPRMATGERVVLFLTAPSRHGLRVPVGAAQGAFFLREGTDGEVRVERRMGGLSLVEDELDERADRRRRGSYVELAGRIESAVARARERRARRALREQRTRKGGDER